MNKQELKEIIKQLKLDGDLESLLFELVDNTKDINAALLNGIADILDLQADFHEKVADILEEEARAYDSLNLELNRIDEDIQNRRLEEIAGFQEELTEGLEGILDKLKVNQQEEPPSQSTVTTPPEATTSPATA